MVLEMDRDDDQLKSLLESIKVKSSCVQGKEKGSDALEEDLLEVVFAVLPSLSLGSLSKVREKCMDLSRVDFLKKLPPEACLKILSLCSATDLCQVAAVSSRWRQLALDWRIWRTLLKRDYGMCFDKGEGDLYSEEYKKEFILRRNWAKGIYDLTTLRFHTSLVTGLVLTKKYIITSSKDGSVVLFHYYESGEGSRKTLYRHDGEANCICFDGEVVYSGGTDSLIRSFSLFNEQQSIYVDHSENVTHVKSNEQHLVSASDDRTLVVWDKRSCAPIWMLTGHEDEIKGLELWENWAASTSWDGTLRLWSVDNGFCENVVREDSFHQDCYCVVLKNSYLVSGYASGTIRKQSMSEFEDVSEFVAYERDEVYCIDFTESRLVSGSDKGLIKVWNKYNELLFTLSGHIGVIRSIAVDSWKIVSAGDRRQIIIWDLKTGKELTMIHRQPSLVQIMKLTSTHIASASDADGTMSLVSFDNPAIHNFDNRAIF
eukprot:Nk52_evm20s162 gene=Nk52_evmTU20s162